MKRAVQWLSPIGNLAAALCLVGCLAAGEPAWDWLPRAADADRPCEIHLTAPSTWQSANTPGLVSSRLADQLILTFEPQRLPQVLVHGPADRQLTIRCLAPGLGAELTTDSDGRLRIGEDAVVLAVPRREAAADRRWGILRVFAGDRVESCSSIIDEPAPLSGLPALTRQIAASQSVRPTGGVLVMLSGDDRFAAWKHREYRQALAWLVGDLATRGATHVVLVEPTCPATDEPLLAPLRLQVRDVARAYRCTAVNTVELGEHALWEQSPGVLGTQLNASGTAKRTLLLLPWLNRGG